MPAVQSPKEKLPVGHCSSASLSGPSPSARKPHEHSPQQCRLDTLAWRAEHCCNSAVTTCIDGSRARGAASSRWAAADLHVGACRRLRASARFGWLHRGMMRPSTCMQAGFPPLGAPLPPPPSVLPPPPNALRAFDPNTILFLLQMYLMYYTNEKGERVYTLKVRARLEQGCRFARVAGAACMHPHCPPAWLRCLLPRAAAMPHPFATARSRRRARRARRAAEGGP